jgi:hypothetical protein
VVGRHLVGDHNLFLAEVLSGSTGDGMPLLTFAGRLDRSTVDGPRPSSL